MDNKINYDDITLSKVKFNSKQNLTELLHPDFLRELKKEFGEIRCINIALDISETETPQLILIGHGSNKDITNKVMTAEFRPVGAANNDNPLKKIIEIMKE